MDNLKFIGKKGGGISKRGIVKERIYKDENSIYIDIFPSDLSGSLDDFFLGGHNG